MTEIGVHKKSLDRSHIYDVGLGQGQNLWWRLGWGQGVVGVKGKWEQDKVKGLKEIYMYVVNILRCCM